MDRGAALSEVQFLRAGQPREIAVLSATPQHSSTDKAFCVAGAVADEFALRNGVPGVFRLRCGYVADDPPRSLPCPAWLSAVVADVAANFRGADGVKIRRRPRAPGHRPHMDRRQPFCG